MRARRLRFGDRVLCPFLRPFFLDADDEARVKAVVERLWVLGERVLYVGDNARADIRAARSYGWKTVHVVAELSQAGVPSSLWGSPFTTGRDPSWCARVIGEAADAVCDRVDRLLARAPNERIEVEGETA